MSDCNLEPGSRAILLERGEVRYGQATYDLRACSLETGSTVRIYTEAPSEREADRLLTQEVQQMEEEEADTVKEIPVPAEIETVEEIPVSAEIEQATAVASDIGGEYAPALALALALLAVLGGKKAWSFYSERAEQKHELELKRLDLQRDMAGTGSSPPPSCQAVYTQIEASLKEVQARLASVEKRIVVIDDDFDSEDVARKIKRLQRAVRDLQDASPV